MVLLPPYTLVGLVTFGYKYGLRSNLRAPNFKDFPGASPPSVCVLTHAPSSVLPPISITFSRHCTITYTIKPCTNYFARCASSHTHTATDSHKLFLSHTVVICNSLPYSIVFYLLILFGTFTKRFVNYNLY